MNHYKTVVIDFMQSDRAVFVNAECCLELGELTDPDKAARRCSCDAVAIDLRHGSVYLCEATFERNFQALIKKRSAWTRNWDSIKNALQRDCRVPANWRVHVWLFTPRDSVEMLDAKLEHLRHTVGSELKVKITALEDVQPWRASNWTRSEEAWETIGQNALI